MIQKKEEYSLTDVTNQTHTPEKSNQLPVRRRSIGIPHADTPSAYDNPAYDNPAFLESGQGNYVKSVDIGRAESLKSYDPHDFGNTHKPTSLWDTVFHLMIIIAGPCVLSIPVTFVGAGYVTALILLPLLFCLYIHNVNIVIWSEYQLCKIKRTPTLSYPEVAYHAFKDGPSVSQWFAKWCRRLVYLDFTLIWFSFYCYNYVIVSQNLQILMSNIFHVHVSVTTIIEILLLPLLMLACIPKLKYLVPFSFMGSVFNIISLLLIVYFILVDPTPWRIPSSSGKLKKIPLFVGAVLANLNIMGLMIPLKNEMKKPSKFGSRFGAVNVSFMSATVVYSAFSLICALKYGNEIQPSVIENLPETDIIAQIGIGVSSLSIICQQPLLLHVPFDIIWNQILKNKIQSFHSSIWEYFLRLFLVFITFGISLAVPNVFVFISISGTVGTSIDSLILPPLIHIVLQRQMSESKLKFLLIFIKNMGIIVLGVILMVYGGIDSVQGIMEYYADDQNN